MNPFLLQFTNGMAFFAGVIMACAGGSGLCIARRPFFRSGCTILGVLGIVVVVLSSTPLPWWQYAVWLTAALATIAVGRRDAPGLTAYCRWLVVALIALSALLMARELPYHWRPTVAIRNGTPVYVIGDSISAGISREETPWPELLGVKHGIKTTNLAQAGATTGMAVRQAERVEGEGALVIVEIGGNDLLGGVACGVFQKDLNALLQALSRKQCRLVMFELPLPPTFNSYGLVQRALAAQYGATLLPKWYLTRALGLRDGTLDGRHLSQAGHALLADEVGSVFPIELRAGEDSASAQE